MPARLLAPLSLGLVALATSALAAPPPVTAKATTKDYTLELDIGRTEHMYPASEVAAKHLTAGEVMVGGKMTMAMGPGWHHLELHVRARKSGAPVTGAKVRIVVTDLRTHAKALVPIAVMYGIPEGKADWHYGNNVHMAPGRYGVAVSANGEHATFDVTIPAG